MKTDIEESRVLASKFQSRVTTIVMAMAVGTVAGASIAVFQGAPVWDALLIAPLVFVIVLGLMTLAVKRMRKAQGSRQQPVSK